MKKIISACCCIFALLLCASVSRADSLDGVTFTLVNADLTGNPGSVLTWQYDVANNSGGAISANSIAGGNFTSGMADSTIFDFFNLFTGIADGASLMGPLFSFTADPLITNSFNSGTFDLNISLSDGTPIDLNDPYSATISPVVTPVPEPPALLLLLAGISVALFVSARKRI
jgi:hypothetical protein